MKNRKYAKLLLDLVLLVLLALMYQKKVISMHFHETGGLVLMGLFFLHKALNWKWIRGVTTGIFRRKAKVNAAWLVDALLLLSMTAVLITGLLISKTLPTTLANGFWLRPWHYFSAALALGLSGIHLGLHWAWLKNTVWNRLPVSGRLRTGIGALLLCIVMGFGTFSMVTTLFLSWFAQPFAVSEAVHEEGHDFLPGMEMGEGHGKGGGKGLGRGPGKGMGKGAQQLHDISPANVLHTAVSYASILLWFAVLTAAVQGMIRHRKRKQCPSPHTASNK